MQNHGLTETGPEPLGERCDFTELKALEPCIFHVQSLAALRKNASLVRLAISKTGMTILSLSVRTVSELGFYEVVRSFPGLYAISVRYKMMGVKNPFYTNSLVDDREGDTRVVSHYGQLLETFRFTDREPVKVIPEIEVTDDLSLLGPTLMALSRFCPPWLVLAVHDAPSKQRIDALKDCFEYLQMRNFPLIDIHFSLENRLARDWKAQSECFYSGPEMFHIDLSNRCTHSCVFCSIYAPAIQEDLKVNHRLDERMRRFMSAQLDEAKALALIQTLPVTTVLVQLGGAGDPMLHPKAMELIQQLRHRAILVEVLSNMEYLKEEDLEKLTELGGRLDESLKFIVNISAATPETYVRTRPRQSPAVFHKVVANLRRLSELRRKNGGMGAHFTLLCVVNRFNFHEASLYVDLAAELGAACAWFKPMEIHHRLQYDLLPTPQERPVYARSLRAALRRADQRGVAIFDRPALEDTLKTYATAEGANP